jgi:uncharacterized protein
LKFAVVILVVLLGIWFWRRNRADSEVTKKDSSMQSPQTSQKEASAQMMLSCAVCGIHLPKNDAQFGKLGSYCSSAHRQQREG